MSAKSRKLLFVVNDAKFLVSHRLPLAQAARDAGYEVSIMAAPQAESQQIFAKEKFGFIPLSISRSGTNILKELRVFLNCVQQFRTHKPDVVFLVSIKAVIYGGIATRLAHMPAVVMTISGRGYVFVNHSLRAVVLRFLALFLYRLAFAHTNARVIFQNPDDQQFFVNAGVVEAKKTVLIKGAGVDVQQFTPPAAEQPLPVKVMMVSRLLKDKGVTEFAEAARILKAAGHAIEFVLVGDIDPGNPASFTAAEYEALQTGGDVTCLGHRSDIAALYQTAHIASLPSYGEGLPKSLLEALACGLPIITTDVPGCREVVEAGKNGLLVPPRDAKMLAEAVLQLANDPEGRKAMGKRSRSKAETEFDVKQVVAATLRVFEELQKSV